MISHSPRLLHYDDVIGVTRGDIVPTDGVTIDGEIAVEESSLTGEPFPVGKRPGSSVTAGTVLVQNLFNLMVTRLVPQDSLSAMGEAIARAGSFHSA